MSVAADIPNLFTRVKEDRISVQQTFKLRRRNHSNMMHKTCLLTVATFRGSMLSEVPYL